jgi:hypothetical protein
MKDTMNKSLKTLVLMSLVVLMVSVATGYTTQNKKVPKSETELVMITSVAVAPISVGFEQKDYRFENASIIKTIDFVATIDLLLEPYHWRGNENLYSRINPNSTKYDPGKTAKGFNKLNLPLSCYLRS